MHTCWKYTSLISLGTMPKSLNGLLGSMFFEIQIFLISVSFLSHNRELLVSVIFLIADLLVTVFSVTCLKSSPRIRIILISSLILSYYSSYSLKRNLIVHTSNLLSCSIWENTERGLC